jgi:hypothetical protein
VYLHAKTDGFFLRSYLFQGASFDVVDVRRERCVVGFSTACVFSLRIEVSSLRLERVDP